MKPKQPRIDCPHILSDGLPGHIRLDVTKLRHKLTGEIYTLTNIADGGGTGRHQYMNHRWRLECDDKYINFTGTTRAECRRKCAGHFEAVDIVRTEDNLGAGI